MLYGAGQKGLTDVIHGFNPGCKTKGFEATIGWDPVGHLMPLLRFQRWLTPDAVGHRLWDTQLCLAEKLARKSTSSNISNNSNSNIDININTNINANANINANVNASANINTNTNVNTNANVTTDKLAARAGDSAWHIPLKANYAPPNAMPRVESGIPRRLASNVVHWHIALPGICDPWSGQAMWRKGQVNLRYYDYRQCCSIHVSIFF